MSEKKLKLILSISFMISIIAIMIIMDYIGFYIKNDIDTKKFGESFNAITLELEKEKSIYEVLQELEKINSNIYGMPLQGILNTKEYIKHIPVQPIYEKEKYLEEKYKIEGRYFNEEDFLSGEKVAIIGKNLQEDCFIENDKKFIEFEFGQEVAKFEVIGVLKNDFYLDTTIMIPIESLKLFKIVEYKNTIHNFLWRPKEKINILEGQKIIDISSYQGESLIKIILNNVMAHFEIIKNLVICLLISAVNIAVFSMFWARSMRKRLAIFRVLGADGRYILKYIASKVFCICAIATVTSGIILFIFSKFMYLQDIFKFESFIGGIFITLVLMLLSILVAFKDIIKFNLLKVIR